MAALLASISLAKTCNIAVCSAADKGLFRLLLRSVALSVWCRLLGASVQEWQQYEEANRHGLASAFEESDAPCKRIQVQSWFLTPNNTTSPTSGQGTQAALCCPLLGCACFPRG